MILIKSTDELEETQKLLKSNLPSYRQAYSDRTAWLMACLSELAYVKFNPLLLDKQKTYFEEKISKLLGDNKSKSLVKLIELVNYDPNSEEKKLEEDIKLLNLKLERTFDNNGSQAILVSNDNYIFLSFRGTEPTSIKDIKSDANAIIKKCSTGGKIHSGFSDAFDNLCLDIDKTINEDKYKDKPLFVSGHSLGGAVAMVATKRLKHLAGIAACYTFGAPRVGDMDWAENIKTPIYRIVNAADPVTMLPPSSDVVRFASFFLGLIPHFGKKIKTFLISKFGGYYHAGNMRYLTNCEAGDYDGVKLLYSVSWWFRIRAFFKNKASFFKMPADHSITVYRNKLKNIAINRNI